jgi:hypothetical protein
MSTDADVIARIDEAFGLVERPEHFTNFTHCCECAEHDGLLRSRDRETLRTEDCDLLGACWCHRHCACLPLRSMFDSHGNRLEHFTKW